MTFWLLAISLTLIGAAIIATFFRLSGAVPRWIVATLWLVAPLPLLGAVVRLERRVAPCDDHPNAADAAHPVNALLAAYAPGAAVGQRVCDLEHRLPGTRPRGYGQYSLPALPGTDGFTTGTASVAITDYSNADGVPSRPRAPVVEFSLSTRGPAAADRARRRIEVALGAGRTCCRRPAAARPEEVFSVWEQGPYSVVVRRNVDADSTSRAGLHIARESKLAVILTRDARTCPWPAAP